MDKIIIIREPGNKLKSDEREGVIGDIASSQMTKAEIKQKWHIGERTYQRYRGKKLEDLGGMNRNRGREGKSRLSGERLLLFTESARLLSVPAASLIAFLRMQFPAFAPHIKSGFTKSPQMDALSMLQYQQIIRKIFGVNYRTKKDPSDAERDEWVEMNRMAKRNIKVREEGNLAVHAIEVKPGNPDTSPRNKSRKTGASLGKMMIGIVADRGLYANGWFKVFIIGKKLDDDVVANEVRTFLSESGSVEVKEIRLVCEMKGEDRIATAVTCIESFASKLGKAIPVTMDNLPTIGVGPTLVRWRYKVDRKLTNAIKATNQRASKFATQYREDSLRISGAGEE